MLPAAVRQLATGVDDKSVPRRMSRGRGPYPRVSECSRGSQAAGNWGAQPRPAPGKPAAGFGTFAGSGRKARSHGRNSGPDPHPAWGGEGGRAGSALCPAPCRPPPGCRLGWGLELSGVTCVRGRTLRSRALRLPRDPEVLNDPAGATELDPTAECWRKGGAEAAEQGLSEVGPRPSQSASARASPGAGVPPQSLPIPSLSSGGLERAERGRDSVEWVLRENLCRRSVDGSAPRGLARTPLKWRAPADRARTPPTRPGRGWVQSPAAAPSRQPGASP